MTVKELIEELQKYDGGVEVIFDDFHYPTSPTPSSVSGLLFGHGPFWCDGRKEWPDWEDDDYLKIF